MKGVSGGAGGVSWEWVTMSTEDAPQGLSVMVLREGRQQHGGLGLREARDAGSLQRGTRGWMGKQTRCFPRSSSP